MDALFWNDKWERNEIAFHVQGVNPLLAKFLSALSLEHDSRVFVPLCGKSGDIAWLLAQGHRVAGVELNKGAVDQLFSDLALDPDITDTGELLHYRAENIDIFVGDLFQLSCDTLGPVDAIYDRAAYVALPETMRRAYSAHLNAISRGAPQLLICYEYDQQLAEGPPFSIGDAEVARHYGDNFNLTLIDSVPVAGGLKGKFPATEKVWLLSAKRVDAS